jgi:hypothetical protein
MEEKNHNLRARQLDVYEAHLHRSEHICDRHEAGLRAARLRVGAGIGGHNRVKGVLYVIYFP